VSLIQLDILLYCLLIVLLLLLPLSFSLVTVIFAGDLSSITPTTSSILLSSHATNDDEEEEPLLVLEGVTLIDGTANSPKPNSLIIIRGDKIAAVTNETGHHDELLSFVNSSSNNNGDSNRSKSILLNLTGKYVIPGLFDMHAHVAGVRKDSLYNQTLSEDMLKMLLDYGVTTIRNPGGPTAESVALKQNVSKDNIQGPEIFTAGRLIDSPQIPIPFVEKQVSSEEEVREEIRNQAAAGVDYVKLYVGLPPDLVKAAIDEAHVQEIKVIGHLYMTSWTDAANFGIDALTHGLPVSPYLLPTTGDARKNFYENGGNPFSHFLWLDLVDLNSPEINEMINALVENDVPVDPTLSIYEAMLKDGAGSFSDRQNQLRWTKVLQLTRIMLDRGVQILAGSDIPNFGLVPGASLHRELELLVEAGIHPLKVIDIATQNGAEALGINGTVGTLEIGKQADMIILDADPLENISNTKTIEAVIADGRFVGRYNNNNSSQS
jgi:imidazolonepropionase-like amidohydrolase